MRLIEKPGPLLAERTTIRLGGRAQLELVAPTAASLEDLPAALERLGMSFLMLGRGSNLLVKDMDIPLVVLSLDLPDKPEVVAEDAKSVIVRTPASMGLPRLLGFLAIRGMAGMTGLAGIPGTVGGAVAMNAGSFGQTIGRCLHRVRVMLPESGLIWLEPEAFLLSYRRFELRDKTPWFVVVEAEFQFLRQPAAVLAERLREVFRLKRTTQPLTAHSAGCAFKNPSEEIPAGWLLEEVGLKGRRLGGMAFSDIHANYLVNLGGGTSEQALELLNMARERVKRHSGHDLELEVKVVPCC